MALQATGLADLISTTLQQVEKLKFTDITSDLQKYIAMSRLLKKNKTVFDSGTDFSWELMTNDSGSAEFKGFYAQDVINDVDVMARATVPWRYMTWNWPIERRIMAMNRSPLKIVDMALTKRISSLISAVKKFENRFWRVPSSTDDLNPYGVPYWIVKSATEGFYGLLPSGYTSVGGVVPSSILNSDGTSRWANYTFQYAAVTRDDLVRKWRRAANMTDWETPTPDMPTFSRSDEYGQYTNYAMRALLVEILQGNNDNLGKDLAAYDSMVTFMQRPVEWVPQLDEDTTNPIYGIPWGDFGTAALRGEWLYETVMPIISGQHTVGATFTDCTFNWFMKNRRRGYVGATGTTMPA